MDELKHTKECERIQGLIDEYVSNLLPDEDRKAVEKHLRECPVCRKLTGFAEALAEAVKETEKAGKGYHIDAQTIARLAIDPESLPQDEKDAIDYHLASCKACRDTFEKAKAVAIDADLVPTAPQSFYLISRFLELARMLTRPVAPAWIAAACAAAIIVGFFVANWSNRQEQAIIPPGQVLHFAQGEITVPEPEQPAPRIEASRVVTSHVPRVAVLTECVILNSMEEIPSALSRTPKEIRIGSSGEALNLVLERPYLLRGIDVVSATIVEIKDGVVSAQYRLRNIPLPDGNGPFLVAIPRNYLREGEYLLVLTPVTAQSQPMNLVAYPFTVITE